MFKFIIIKFIRIYQLIVSPFLGANCRFNPTCSQYTIDCFTEFNFFKALYYSLIRILKCHPFHPGGNDGIEKISKD